MIDKELIDTLKELEAKYREHAKKEESLINLIEYTKTFREILEKKFLEDMKAMGLGVRGVPEVKNMWLKDYWENIHATRAWGKYPNEELVRFIGSKISAIPTEDRKKIKVLEVGCGQGANLWFLAKEGFEVHGVDISSSAIIKAEAYLKEAYDVKANLKVADIGDLPYKNEHFDIVIDCATIQHVSFSDHEKAYNEIYRVLKPSGLFWCFHIAEGREYDGLKEVDYKTYNNSQEGPLADTGLVCTLSDTDLINILVSKGLKIISVEKQVRTYNNQEKEISHWIIVCEKEAI